MITIRFLYMQMWLDSLITILRNLKNSRLEPIFPSSVTQCHASVEKE